MTKLAIALLLCASACRGDLEEPRDTVTLDEPYFRCQVQPVLTELCSTFACHGSGDRYFTIFARSRLRLGGDESQRNAFLRDEERAFNYEAAMTMVDPDAPDESLLLLKPLEPAAGGYYHVGAEVFEGGDVFASQDNPSYRVLLEWVRGATDDPTCIEPGSDL